MLAVAARDLAALKAQRDPNSYSWHCLVLRDTHHSFPALSRSLARILQPVLPSQWCSERRCESSSSERIREIEKKGGG